ncbi:unnamed protein product [Chironomus riparius]|uniref:Protein Wnt n=1 Tax=Chironomus riparius TaxID=315576 RepID=A0A9N9WNE2_9DIPT|nr:unnamed protein product [Chironomus riparius]
MNIKFSFCDAFMIHDVSDIHQHVFNRCLGIKSPFIEFTADYETISDVSVSLNLSDKNPDPRHRKNGLHNLGNFINPIGRDEKTGFKGINKTKFSIQSDLLEAKDSRKHQEQQLYELQQQQIQELQQQNLNKSATNKILMDIIKPIVTDIHKSEDDEHTYNNNNNIQKNNNNNSDHPTIQIIANANSHYEQMDSYADDSRHKVIMPLALKTTLIERERSIPTPTTTPKPQSNIEDLKNHLLMLKNYSEVDKSFQSKFVIFKKSTTTTTTPEPTTTTKVTTTSVRTTTMQFPMTIGTMYRTKPSINMPNVQNSQILRDVSYPYTRVERVTVVPQVFLQNDQQQPDTEEEKRQRSIEERRKNQKNEKKSKKERKKNRNNKQQASNMIPTTTTAVPLRSMRREQRQRQLLMRSYNNGSQVLIGTSPTTSSEPYIINLNDKPYGSNTNINQNDNNRKLSRAIRSKANRRRNQNKMQRDVLIPIESSTVKNETNEKIDLNPKHCYDVSGMSKGQQKLCEQFTGIMPAISRGARAAIQECQHQFQHRRWNCSTVDDNTVFGPVSAIGSPEMAFVYAMASAAVTSFIARACRDGQLTTCGCSRSARPKQLHEDWTWGGCGDDLEFGYKYSQNFVDIREKERKRGARGLVTVPKTTELMGNETAGDNTTTSTTLSPEEQAKTDEMLKLQQKITQEILNSNLKEKEMNELQEKINKEILNSKIFNMNADHENMGRKKNRFKTASNKARALMNLHNNEAGRRAAIKKHQVLCTCHGISGSCSLITCWQQLSSVREIGDYLREQYEQATQVKMNKRGRLQVKDSRYKVPTALDLVYLDESPDWCRANKQLQWPGTHGRKCNRTSTGLDSCSILCCGRGYNTKKIVLYERCNCKFQWCCNVRCETCKRVIQEYTCK